MEVRVTISDRGVITLPADQPVLAAAIHLGCEVLVTGDRSHFGKLYGRTIQDVTVLSPRLLAERLSL